MKALPGHWRVRNGSREEKRMQLWFDSIESDHKGDPKRESKSFFSPEKPKSKILRGYCVGQFCPRLQQCKGKGPAQYLVWGDTNIRGRPAKERAKLPSEERCSMLARSGDCVRGLWSPRHFCPRCLVGLLITRNSAQDNLITSQRGKYPTKSSGRKWQISSDAVTSALNVPQLTFWPH